MSGCVSRASRQLPCGRVQCAARARSRVDEPALGAWEPGSPGDGDGDGGWEWKWCQKTDQRDQARSRQAQEPFPHSSNLQLPGRLNHHLQFGSVQCRGQGVSAAAALQAEAAGHPAALQNPPERRWPIAGNSRPQSVARPEEPAQPTWDPGWTVDGWKGARASRKKGQRWAATPDRDGMAQKPAHLFQDPIPSAGHSSALARRLRQAQHSAFSIQLGAQHRTRRSAQRSAANPVFSEARRCRDIF